MQLGLGRGGAPLNVVGTWKAVVGGSMGYRALLVGALPRVSTTLLDTTLVKQCGHVDSLCMVCGSQGGPGACTVHHEVSCFISFALR